MNLLRQPLALLLTVIGLGAFSVQAADPLPFLIPLPAPVPATVLNEHTQGEIRFDSRTPFDFDLLLNHYDQAPRYSALGHLFLPPAASAQTPVPAMVVLPGSGGIMPGREMEYGALLRDNGYAAIVVDYYLPRGLGVEVPYPLKTISVTEFDVLADAYAALRTLNQHPAIDGNRIGVMGFSYGGMATRLAMDVRTHQIMAPEFKPFALHVDYYGPCFQQFNTPRTTGAPLLALRGAEDDSNDLVECARREHELRTQGSEVGTLIFASAGHSWENLAPRVRNNYTYVLGCVIDYDAAGLPSVSGKQMIAADTPHDRESRFQLRLRSSPFFEGCLRSGYIVGRDEPVKQESDRQLLMFLDKVFHGKPHH